MPSTSDNPEGYWEDLALVGLNEALLKSLGSRWDSVAPLPDRWWELPPAIAARHDAAKIVTDEWADTPLAVVKDPRLCRLLPLWRTAFAEAGYSVSCVLMTRQPTEVAGSLARRDGFGTEKAFTLWLSHLIEAERDSRGLPRSLVTYDSLLALPADAIERIRVEASFPLAPSPEQLQAAVAFVRPELKRQRARAPGERQVRSASSLDVAFDAAYDRLSNAATIAEQSTAIAALANEAGTLLAPVLPQWLVGELCASQAVGRAIAAELENARTTVATLNADIAAARTAHAARDEIEASMRRNLARAERELFDERSTTSALAAQIATARSSAEDFERQIETARIHIDDLARQIDEARRAHAARDEIEASLERECRALRDEVANRGLEVATLAQRARRAEAAVEEKIAELERRAASERALTADRDRLLLVQREASARIVLLEGELASLDAESKRLRRALDAATTELDRLSARWFGRVARRLARA